MKKILMSSARDNHTKSEITMLVFRGHASVQLVIDTYKANGEPSSVEVYLHPQDATKLADAVRLAPEEVLSKSAIE